MFTKARLRIYFWIFVILLALAIYWHRHETKIRDEQQMPYGHGQVAVIENLIQNHWVQVWKAIVSPGEPSHYHHNATPRILIALKGGQLKITNTDGAVHYLDLPTNTAVWVDKDSPGQEHTTIVEGSHPLEAIVIEIKPEVASAFELYQAHEQKS